MEEILVLKKVKIEDRESFLTDIYKRTFPIVAKHTYKMGGSFDDAKDVFHDALVIYYEKYSDDRNFSIKNNKAFILGLCKNLWVNRYREKSKYSYLGSPLEDIQFNSTESEIVSSKLIKFLSTAGKKCMDLLSAFYFDKLPLATIGERFGFSGVRSTTAQKYKCLEKVRNTVRERSLSYDDFIE